MTNRAVLNIGVLTNAHSVDIATNLHPVPNVGFVTNSHITHNSGIHSDKNALS